MQILKKNKPHVGYETEDIVVVVSDAHVWASGELNASEFTIQTGVTITDSEASKLEMLDQSPTNSQAISKLPAFRSIISGAEGLRVLRRRKYQWISGALKLKDNAGVV